MQIRYFRKSLLWLLIVVILSLIPGGELPRSPRFIPHFDKLVHFVMYFILIVLFLPPLNKLRPGKAFLPALIVTLIVGCLLEILQQTLAVNRSGSLTDVAANAAGALAGILVYRYLIAGKKTERFLL